MIVGTQRRCAPSCLNRFFDQFLQGRTQPGYALAYRIGR